MPWLSDRRGHSHSMGWPLASDVLLELAGALALDGPAVASIVLDEPATASSSSSPPSSASLPMVGKVMSVGLRPAAARVTRTDVGGAVAVCETPSNGPAFSARLPRASRFLPGNPWAVIAFVEGTKPTHAHNLDPGRCPRAPSPSRTSTPTSTQGPRGTVTVQDVREK